MSMLPINDSYIKHKTSLKSSNQTVYALSIYRNCLRSINTYSCAPTGLCRRKGKETVKLQYVFSVSCTSKS